MTEPNQQGDQGQKPVESGQANEPLGKRKPDTVSQIVRVGTAIVALIVVLFLCFNSSVYFTPFARITIFLVVASLPAIMFGTETAAHFKVEFKWIVFSAFGLGAFYLGVVFVAYLISKPELQVVAFQVVNEKDEPVVIDAPGVLSISKDSSGLSVSWFAKYNEIIMIFPEQVTKVTMRINDRPEKSYTCEVAYAGIRKSVLKYGAELK
jgi:hypothetical protein